MNKFQLIKSKYYGLSLSGSNDPIKPLKKKLNFYSSYKWLLARSYVKGAVILKVLSPFKINFDSFILTEKYMFLRTVAILTLSKFLIQASFYYTFISTLFARWQTYLVFLLKIDSFFNKNTK